MPHPLQRKTTRPPNSSNKASRCSSPATWPPPSKTLEKISDPIVLTKDQRQQLSAALDVLDNVEVPEAAPVVVEEVVVEVVEETPAAAPAEPTPADVLAQADGLAASDPGTAIALYTTLIEEGGDAGENRPGPHGRPAA